MVVDLPSSKSHRVLPSNEQAHAAAAAFAMLADPTRLLILWLVSVEELDVTTIASLVGANPPAVSQHLAKLRLSGLVETRKDGRQVFYRARDTHVRALITEALYHADHHVSGLADHD